MSAGFRVLGLAPLLFFLAHLRYHIGIGETANSLWMCHISNLLLAAGLLFQKPWFIRLATIWMVPGLPIWLLEMGATGHWNLTSCLSHFGGLAVGLMATGRVGFDRHTWIYGCLWFVAMQGLCRWTTPPNLNVNLAHGIWSGWHDVFPSYLIYELTILVLVCIGLWLTGLGLAWAFPVKQTNSKPLRNKKGSGFQEV